MEAQPVTAAYEDRPDRVCPPALAAKGQLQRARHPWLDRDRPRVGGRCAQAARQLEQHVEAVGTCRRVKLDGQPYLLLLERTLAVEGECRGELRVARDGGCGDGSERERRRDRHELHTAEGEPGEQTDRREAEIRDPPRRRDSRHPATSSTSSAGGVGTVSSASATTSSPRMRCTQSSGRSVSRWARAGTAIDFTSSGTTKSRPASAAFPRASFSSPRLPRGLAPTARRGEARVAVTRSTM